ncbi:MAG: PH domain-containing protein [Ruminococcus flavefaciens]|nr:PH domain-containing protein [Ruminococcus flavefaciens]
MELPVQMRSARELYQYSCDNGFGVGFGKNWGLRNFGLLEKQLESDECAFLTFVGLHRFHSMSAHQRNFAYAITDRRILMAQSRSFWRTRFESIPLNAVMNLSFDSGNAIAVMKIMLESDAIAIGMSPECAEALSTRLTELLPLIQDLAKRLGSGKEPDN